MKAKYALVRVGKDGSCVEEFVCSGDCNKCNYGDTKEQLIRKVAQAIKKSLRQGFTKGYKEIATDVVEFLGVEE